MTKNPTDHVSSEANLRKPWQAPELTVLPADEAESAASPSGGDGIFSKGS
jgi:hypothetical protein